MFEARPSPLVPLTVYANPKGTLKTKFGLGKGGASLSKAAVARPRRGRLRELEEVAGHDRGERESVDLHSPRLARVGDLAPVPIPVGGRFDVLELEVPQPRPVVARDLDDRCADSDPVTEDIAGDREVPLWDGVGVGAYCRLGEKPGAVDGVGDSPVLTGFGVYGVVAVRRRR